MALATGGYLPPNRYGQKENGMIHVADWYVTFCQLGGLSLSDCVSDDKASKWGLPSVDGLNVWNLVSGVNNTSPRVAFPVTIQAYIRDNYKLIVGSSIDYAGWAGEIYPNASSPHNVQIQSIKANCTNGCLFDVVNDMTEHHDIATENVEIVELMMQEYEDAKKSFYSNNEKGENACPSNVTIECACWMANHYWKGFLGPYQYFTL